jgi:hypothetical protein
MAVLPVAVVLLLLLLRTPRHKQQWCQRKQWEAEAGLTCK